MCEWTQNLQGLSDKLPNRNKLRKRVIQLLRDSICDYKTKTVHCCNKEGEVDIEPEDTSIEEESQVPRRTMVRELDVFKLINFLFIIISCTKICLKTNLTIYN